MNRLIAFAILFPLPVLAADPKVVSARLEGPIVQIAQVTLLHPDTGWDHYADGWEIVTQDGTRVGFRELAHPHVTEQPFIRSIKLDEVPDGPLFVRARCSVDGWSDTLVPVVRD